MKGRIAKSADKSDTVRSKARGRRSASRRTVDAVPGRIETNGASASRDELVRVAQRLRVALKGVLRGLPGDDVRPIPLARQLGLNKNLTSKLLAALAKGDEIAMVRELPGPVPLASFLRAAKEARATPTSITRAESALESFRRLIAQEFGDKTHLDTLLASWLPESSARAELTARQLSFRGASLIKGLSADVDVASFIMYPSRDDPAFADVGVVSGRIGLRRIRHGVQIRLSGGTRHPATTSDRSSDVPDHAVLAERFSREFSDDPLPLTIRDSSSGTEYVIDDRGIGPKSAIRVFVAECYERKISLLRPLEGRRDRRCCSVAVVDEPCKTLVLETLIHRDIWPHLEPELCIYDTAKNGRTSPMDEDRSADLMTTNDRVEALGVGVDRFATPLIPRHVEMIRYVCNARGWDADALRGYRCVSRYPFYSSQMSICWSPFG